MDNSGTPTASQEMLRLCQVMVQLADSTNYIIDVVVPQLIAICRANQGSDGVEADIEPQVPRIMFLRRKNCDYRETHKSWKINSGFGNQKPVWIQTVPYKEQECSDFKLNR